MRIAIMQPTYLPWCGYFDLMDQVDHFVFLDDVAFARRSWQQRNRIKTARGLEWLTVPVQVRGKRGDPLDSVEIAEPGFWHKHLQTIDHAYARAPRFRDLRSGLEELLQDGAPWSSLVDLDLALIRWMTRSLGIHTPTSRASQLDVGGCRGEHLARLCESLGAREYLSPPGAAGYLVEDAAAFADREIQILFHVYEPPLYQQCFPPFLAQASAIDLLFNEGPRALEILRGGRRPPERAAPLLGTETARREVSAA